MALDFSNTEIAFKGQSNAQLKKAYQLFKMVGKSWLVNFGSGFTKLALKVRLPIKGIIKKTIFAQFCGGENIEECKEVIAKLADNNVGTILDYSIEGMESTEDLDATKSEIIRTIERAKADQSIPFAVFKPSGIAQFSILERANEGIENLSNQDKAAFQAFIQRMDEICKRAYDLKVPVFIDAEDSWIQDTIDRAVESMMMKYNDNFPTVYNTVQLYRWDRLTYLKKLHQKLKQHGKITSVKLVRGAYMEKERERAAEKGYKDPIQPDKKSTDRDYDAAITYCVDNYKEIAFCAGTHNEESSLKLAHLINERNIDRGENHIYFAQLLGMSNHISFNLSHQGYNVAKYVPYGPVKEVLPYLIRRAQENTSVEGQTGRELALIKEELRRRKQL